jgi:hypothetical protein
MNRWAIASRPLHGLGIFSPTLIPPMNQWAIVSRPLHGLGITFPDADPSDESLGHFESSAAAEGPALSTWGQFI